MDLISSVSLSFQRDAAVGVPHILQLVPAPPTLSDTTRGNLLHEIRFFFLCCFLPLESFCCGRARFAVWRLAQGFSRSSTSPLQPQCQVWLPQTPRVSGKVAVFGGQLYRLHLILSALNHQVTSVSASRLPPVPTPVRLAGKCEQMAAAFPDMNSKY